MSIRHSLPSGAEKRPFIARTIRWLSVPIVLGWLALTVVVNVVAPQLEEVGAAHSVPMTAKDAPSTIAMIGYAGPPARTRMPVRGWSHPD